MAAVLAQVYQCVRRRLCLSSEDYVREYFTELELEQRIDLTPMLESDFTASKAGVSYGGGPSGLLASQQMNSYLNQ